VSGAYLGGLVGSRLAHRVLARYGQHRILCTVGTLRAVWLIGLASWFSPASSVASVIAVELAIMLILASPLLLPAGVSREAG
jgi:hypothetical protein